MISRRDWLKAFGLGAAAASATMLPSMRRGAKADPAGIPTRFVIFHAGYGIHRDLWAPTGSETDFTLAEVHAPLTEYKSDLLFLDGMDMLSAFFDANPASNAHNSGNTHALSGDARQKSSSGNYDWSSITIDQYIAREINSPSPVTRFPSLELGVSLDGNVPHISSNGSGDYLPVEDDPLKAFSRLFPSAGDPAGDQRVLQDKSVLDFVSGRYDKVLPRLSNIDKLRVQAHGDAIRDLEKRLALAAAACTPDPTSVAGVKSLKDKGGAYWSGQNWYETTADAQLRIAQTALACDLTRVVSVAFWDPEKSIGFSPDTTIDGVNCSDYHDLVHKTSNGPGGPLKPTPAALASSGTALDYRKKHALVESNNFAKLLKLLRDVPTADGKTLLDHTVVLWCGHIGWGGHDLAFLPWIVAGRGGGAISTGRYVKLPRVPHPDLPADGWFRSPESGFVGDTKIGPAHNDLFVGIANAMGLPITSFGDKRVCKGALAQLKG